MYFVFICSRGQNNIWYYCLADEARLSSKIVTAIKKNNTEYTTGIYNPLQWNFCALVYQYTSNLKRDEKRDYRDVLIILDKQMLLPNFNSSLYWFTSNKKVYQGHSSFLNLLKSTHYVGHTSEYHIGCKRADHFAKRVHRTSRDVTRIT